MSCVYGCFIVFPKMWHPIIVQGKYDMTVAGLSTSSRSSYKWIDGTQGHLGFGVGQISPISETQEESAHLFWRLKTIDDG